MKKGKIAFIVIALLITFFVIYSKAKPKVFEVTAVETEVITVRKTVSASGTVISKNQSNLALAAVGQLQYLAVEKGDIVAKGDLIGNVYNYDSSQSSKALRDSRDIVLRDIDIYRENYETHPNAVGGNDEYLLGLRRMDELLSKAEASYQASLGSLSKTILYAPFSGVVLDIFKDVGEVVTAGTPLVKIADLDALIFEISVDQEDFGALVLDQVVEITLDSYDGPMFFGKVSELPQYADEATEEFIIKIELDPSTEYQILLGMNGDASIIVEEEIDAISLTFDVIYESDDGYYIWIVENGSLVKEVVEIGLEGDVYTTIITDLSGKEIIIPVEEDGLTEGGSVKYGE